MTDIRIDEFDSRHAGTWDEFVSRSLNGTFQLARGYLDYHSDRFSDASLVFKDQHGTWLALLPAHRVDDHLFSHEGLTYGGFVLSDRVRQRAMEDLVNSLLDFARQCRLRSLSYTPVPSIYHRTPVESDIFALARAGAHCTRRHILSVLSNQNPPSKSTLRKRSVNKAEKAGVKTGQTDDWKGFWRMLTARLADRHDARPVHDLQEIELLATRFPESIHLFDSTLNGQQVAGAVVFETERVARIQYMATNEKGRETAALDLLIDWLANERFADKRFIDLGSSQIPGTDELNYGLLDYKEGFGARSVLHNTYTLNIDA